MKSKKLTTTKSILDKKGQKDLAKSTKAYSIYKQTMDLLDRANLASGKTQKVSYSNQSTETMTIKDHGIKSTYKI